MNQSIIILAALVFFYFVFTFLEWVNAADNAHTLGQPIPTIRHILSGQYSWLKDLVTHLW